MTDSGASDSRYLFPLREGQLIAGKYLVQELLGQGGMGVVHAARDVLIDRRVALKALLPRLVTSPVASGRFMQEARASTRITSEHVVKLLDTFTLPDGTPLLVLEYLEGRDLRALLIESGPLPPDHAVDYVLQALQAVAEGHMQSIIHRDLKPSNLFLTERADGTPLLKVLDFGIAKILQPGPAGPTDLALTSSEDIQLGSPVYMPPEQFTNPRDVDARADIWALGVTLYELISGKQPFGGSGYQELVSRVLSAHPDSLRAACPGASLPAGLEQIVGKCLEKSRDARYANAVELAIALAPFGSEDARLSLTRVSGLSRPRSPNPASLARDFGAAYDATLAVPVTPIDRPTHTLSGAPHVPRPAPRSRNWLALGALLAAFVLASIASRPRHAEAPGAVAGAPRTMTSSLSALQAAPSGAEAANLPVLPASASTDRDSPALVARKRVPSTVVPSSAKPAGRVAPTVPALPASTPTPDALSEPAKNANAGPEPESAQDQEIERLIEQRH